MDSSIWLHWHPHPDAIIGLTLILALYLLLVGPYKSKFSTTEHVNPSQIIRFTFGILIILLSLVSPLHILSDTYLFSAHMVQHILITIVAPPLLISGIPSWVIQPILCKNKITIGLFKILLHPLIAFLTFNFIFALWHIPQLYDASVRFHGIHVFEHISFMLSALMMWWPLMSNIKEIPRLSYPMQIIYLVSLSIAQIIVFALITFSSYPIYEWYVDAPRIWGVSPLTDQQIGGIIMKVGTALIFLAMIVAVFFKWYNVENKEI